MISLIIVSYNTRRLLKECLLSIAKHASSAEIVVVDNASKDGSAEMVRSEFPHVILVTLPVNLGFAGANNAGLKLADNPVIVLLNSDTVLEDDSLSRCAEWMLSQPRLGVASPRLIGVDDKPQQCAYAFPSLGNRLRQALRFANPSLPIDLKSTGWIAGTALFLRRDALREVGGQLDDAFFMYWEDADLSARIRRAGWEFALFEDGYIRHYGGASGGGKDEARRPDLHAWYVWGQHRWFEKHMPIYARVCLWLLDAVDVFRKLLRGLIRPGRRFEWVHAKVIAYVLWLRLVGHSPPRPGGGKSAKAA